MRRRPPKSALRGLSADLLEQALVLAEADSKRPKQANLRRAVSSAYYAFFHCLVEAACTSIVGTSQKLRTYREVLARAFEHGAMRDACQAFAGGTLPKVFKPNTSVGDANLRKLASTFVDAQANRHRADYDLAQRFRREDVVASVHEIRDAIGLLSQVQDRDLLRIFLTSLLVWGNLAKR